MDTSYHITQRIISISRSWDHYTPTNGDVLAGGLMFGLHHQEAAGGIHAQPRGPVTSLKEEPLTRAWMTPTSLVDNTK